MTEDDRALAEYKEVTTQFRNLTDIRFKLLAFLPLGTVAAAVFVPGTNDLVKQPAIPAFAFVVTLCIATYNKRNDQHYDELVARAAELERALKIKHGTFSDRPKSWLRYGFIPVEHRWPIGLIYAVSASLWSYLFSAALVTEHLLPMWVRFAAPALVIAGWRYLRWIENGQSKAQRATVIRLMGQLLSPIEGESQGKLVNAIVAAKPILGIDKNKAERRVNFYWPEFQKKRDSDAASTLLSGVIDLPARWIEDVWSGRR